MGRTSLVYPASGMNPAGETRSRLGGSRRITASAPDKLRGHSTTYRIALGPHAGRKAVTLQSAAHLVDHVIPHVPVRQRILSLPIPLPT